VTAEAGTVVAVKGEPGELVSPLRVSNSWEVVVLVPENELAS
jgi:hypothetical protein